MTSLPSPFSRNSTLYPEQSEQTTQKMNLIEVPREQMIIRVWAESIPLWSTATNTAILSLRQGQEVWLRILQRASYLHGYMYSSFSGTILFSDDWMITSLDLAYCILQDVWNASVKRYRRTVAALKCLWKYKCVVDNHIHNHCVEKSLF